jgi:hypothetical protein
VNIGFSTGYLEDYWRGWPWAPMYGGSERICVELAATLAAQGHRVTVRLPRTSDERAWRGVRWTSLDAPQARYDVLFCFDDFERRDVGDRSVLVACRSDPPRHADFGELVFLSQTHAQLMGHPGRPSVGGGVDLADYGVPRKRIKGLAICTSSPDRCPAAVTIGNEIAREGFRFVHTYRPVNGVGHEYPRADVIALQQSAMVHIYPLDPVRPSDFFSMSVLESMAAGTPAIVSDADAMVEMWGSAARVIPRPVRLAEWVNAAEEVMWNPRIWDGLSKRGRERAADLTWAKQAERYLAIALGG